MSVGNFWRAVIARFIANYLMTMTGIEARSRGRSTGRMACSLTCST